jgi:predicted nuclease of predicted toxin-antitoxin system
MIIWIDAQLSPTIAVWIRNNLKVDAIAVRDLGLRDATDREIFMAARQVAAVVMTKDNDFVQLVSIYGTPPQVIWLICGNTSNARLRSILEKTLAQAIAILVTGEKIVEIHGIPV